jgi:tetratricopeptide (TPR) repeat protein
MNPAAETEFLAGNASRQQGDRVQALLHYRAATALSGNDPRYWIACGECLLHLRHWREAVRALTRGIELDPAYGEADARLMLADALMGDGKPRQAVLQLRHVAAMDPTYPGYEAPIAEAKARLGKLART